MINAFAIIGRCIAHPPPADWREQLVARLGSRPRRIGIWAELALYGALECLADAGEAALPPGANLLVASRKGSLSATLTVLEQGRDELPMPTTFLQTQSSQMLAVLAAHLGWSGNASFIATQEMHDVLQLAAAQCGPQGVLLGWIDEGAKECSLWLRLRPSGSPIEPSRIAGSGKICIQDALALDGGVWSPGCLREAFRWYR